MSRHDPLVPGNTLWRTILLEAPSSTTGELTPITTGTVTAFLCTADTAADTADATAADPTLSYTATHIGVAVPAAGQFPEGTWLIACLGSTLTLTLLDARFTDTPPYLIVQRAGEVRVYEKLHYKRAKSAVLA